MTVYTKEGVVFGGFKHGLIRILQCLVTLSDEFPVDIVITSASDGEHMKRSRHYTFEAIDVRSKTMSKNQKIFFKEMLEDMLGPSFTILLEHEGLPNEHFHIQVKKGKSFP